MKWAKLLRRVMALFFATIALWWLVSAGTTGASAARGLPQTRRKLAGELNVWEKLVLSQSPYLRQVRVLTSPLSSEPDDPDGEQAESPLPPAALELEEEPDLPQSAPRDQTVVAQTFLPASDGSDLSAGGVYLHNRTALEVDVETLAQGSISLAGQGKGPQILIVHTHATEAYTQQDGQDRYLESDPYRTVDDGHNVVRVGDEIAAVFAQAGLNVLHDRTLHDYPSYKGAYTRSKATVEEYLAAYPSIAVVLDVHRDALIGEDETVYKPVADNTALPDCAQVMLVVGTGQNTGEHPNWRKNLTLAIALEQAMDQAAPTLARPITLRTSAFNQQLSPGSLLLEVGAHGNTLQESLTAARTFAQATAPIIKELLAG